MTPQWRRIVDEADPAYNADNPVFEAPWYGDDQLTGADTGVAAISVGPCGAQDGYLHWTFSVDNSNRRYLAQRIDPNWAPHVV